MANSVNTIQHEPEFKRVCDGILLHEFGFGVQTWSGQGPDGGADAKWHGLIPGVGTGDWVFQFKWSHHANGNSNRRSTIRRYFDTAKKNGISEFLKPAPKSCDGYVLMTNVPMTVACTKKLQDFWASCDTRSRPFLIWDPSFLDLKLQQYSHLLRLWNSTRLDRAKHAVVTPALDWAERIIFGIQSWPCWPMVIAEDDRIVPPSTPGGQPKREHRRRLLARPPEPEFLRDPQFDEASQILYPLAFKPHQAACAALGETKTAAESSVKQLVPLINLSACKFESPRLQASAEACVAWYVLSNGKGRPRTGSVYVSGNDLHFTGQGPLLKFSFSAASTDAEAALQAALAHIDHVPGRAEWLSRVKVLRSAAIEFQKTVWYPAQLEVDSPVPHSQP